MTRNHEAPVDGEAELGTADAVSVGIIETDAVAHREGERTLGVMSRTGRTESGWEETDHVTGLSEVYLPDGAAPEPAAVIGTDDGKTYVVTLEDDIAHVEEAGE